MTITLASILVALLIGGLEVLGLIRDQFGLEGRLASTIDVLSGNVAGLGYAIVGFFATTWLAPCSSTARSNTTTSTSQADDGSL